MCREQGTFTTETVSTVRFHTIYVHLNVCLPQLICDPKHHLNQVANHFDSSLGESLETDNRSKESVNQVTAVCALFPPIACSRSNRSSMSPEKIKRTVVSPRLCYFCVLVTVAPEFLFDNK